MKKVLFMLVVVSLLLTGSAQAADVLSGSLIITDNYEDVVPNGLSAAKTMAINCGARKRSGNPSENPYLSGNGDHWGANGDTDDKTVNGIVFYVDMWSTTDEARNYNKDFHDSVTDRDLFGDGDGWFFKPERGALYHGTWGSNDGGLSWLANYISGYGWGGNLANWMAPYEGDANQNDMTINGGDGTSRDRFKEILRKSGNMNVGNYDSGQGKGERDMTYEFAVTSGNVYNVKVVAYKNRSEDHNIRVEIDGVICVDKLTTADYAVDKFPVVSKDVAASSGTILVKVGRATDNQGSNSADISMIIVTDITPPVFPVIEETGAVGIVTDNVDDIWNNMIVKANVRALNCGASIRKNDKNVTNPYTSHNGDDWGNDTGDQDGHGVDWNIEGVTFYCDMWSIWDQARNYNNENHDGLTDLDLFGSEDSWKFRPERGAMYHDVANTWGADDGGLDWLANYVSGAQDGGTRNQPWQSPYEGSDYQSDISLSGGSWGEFKSMLRRAGVGNAGSYDSGQAKGERDFTYDISVEPYHLYRVMAIPYRNNNSTDMRVEINGVLVLDDFNSQIDLEAGKFGCVSYDTITVAGQDILTIKAGRSTLQAGGNTNVVMNIITIEDLGIDPDLTPVSGVGAGDDDVIWAPSYQLDGSYTVGDDPSVTLLWTASGPGTPDFHGNEATEDPVVDFPAGIEGDYTLRFTASDQFDAPFDEVVIRVYNDGCSASKGEGTPTAAGDVNGDCVTNLADLAIVAAGWLESTSF